MLDSFAPSRPFIHADLSCKLIVAPNFSAKPCDELRDHLIVGVADLVAFHALLSARITSFPVWERQNMLKLYRATRSRTPSCDPIAGSLSGSVARLLSAADPASGFHASRLGNLSTHISSAVTSSRAR